MLPASNKDVIISFPEGVFTVLIRKSIVLYCGGFHLKECSHVIFLRGPALPTMSEPTPIYAGVNINPSVLYSNKLSFSRVNIVSHASNMLCFSGFDG